MAHISESEVLNLIQKALNLKDKKITIDSVMADFTEWDSLGHLGIIVALDKFFSGKVGGIKEIATADSVRKILDILKKHSLI
ncbi:MAG: acyl carrier protein [Candidatus Omnitrophica bacterium]|nr:acyl carrier protein [Candidatus Omnitrophota bacterium]